MPNIAFKPNSFRYANNMAEKACHVLGSTTRVGLTQALGGSCVISAVRKAGLIAFAVGLVLTIALGGLVATFDLLRFKPVPWILAIPVALAMAGLGQAATGVPFRKLSSQWDALLGWQRGVLGVAILLAFAALLCGVLASFVMSGAV